MNLVAYSSSDDEDAKPKPLAKGAKVVKRKKTVKSFYLPPEIQAALEGNNNLDSDEDEEWKPTKKTKSSSEQETKVHPKHGGHVDGLSKLLSILPQAKHSSAKKTKDIDAKLASQLNRSKQSMSQSTDSEQKVGAAPPDLNVGTVKLTADDAEKEDNAVDDENEEEDNLSDNNDDDFGLMPTPTPKLSTNLEDESTSIPEVSQLYANDSTTSNEPQPQPQPQPQAQARAPPPPRVRPCWQPAVDPASGHTYYYNNITGLTTWDRPADELIVAAAPLQHQQQQHQQQYSQAYT